MKWAIGFCSLFVILIHAQQASGLDDEPCLSAYGCGNDYNYDPTQEFDGWLDDYLLRWGGSLGSSCSLAASPTYSCPGETPQQCRQRCDEYLEQLNAGCRMLVASPYEKMRCWAEANAEYARCVATC